MRTQTGGSPDGQAVGATGLWAGATATFLQMLHAMASAVGTGRCVLYVAVGEIIGRWCFFYRQQFTRTPEIIAAQVIGKEPVVADTVQSGGQDVEEKETWPGSSILL